MTQVIHFLFMAILLCSGALPGAIAKDKLRLGLVAFLGEATNYHALESGYFADEDLAVELVINGAGFHGLKQVVDGDLDIATVAPTPVVYRAMRAGQDLDEFRIIASILESSKLNNIVALDGKTVSSLSDLIGKRVAMTSGTASEYFWYRAATSSGIDPESVTKINLPVPKMAAAAAEGKFDAAVAWSPHDEAIARQGGGDATKLSIGRIYTTSWLVVVAPKYLREHPEAVASYLRALLRAERDLESAPLKVASSQARWMKSDAKELLEKYGQLEFDLSLTEGLLVSLHQQAEWAKEAGYVDNPVPDLRRYLAVEPLRGINPDGIRLLE